MYELKRTIKSLFDRISSLIIFILALPIFMITALMIFLEDGRPIFFYQKRVGLHGKVFDLIKFRSMYGNNVPADQMGKVTGENALVTRVGRIIRRLKIDELPQILNVIKGDMSLIGPRPTIPEQVEKYSPYEKRRLDVKPGMTGWAQVNGNINLSWEHRILLDRWYIDHWSLWLDCIILVKTLAVIFCGERVNSVIVEEAVASEDCDSRSCS